MTGASWQPPRRRRLGYAAAAVAALVIAALSWGRTPAGFDVALPMLIGSVLLLALAGLDVWYGAGLAAGPDGLVLPVGPQRGELVPWESVERIEAVSSTHRGILTLAVLEIDVGERLVVLSRHRLGADPKEVAVALRLMRPSAPPPPR